ncbi:MAG TPA: pitrilysin family protein [Candidatus Krumholzibacteria bacterium]|jgi:zinc protease
MGTTERKALLLAALVILTLGSAVAAKGPEIVTLDSASPLLEIRVMLRTGSSTDPVGMEGLASITADAVLEAGFGEGDAIVSKEDLARITAPWGSDARPGVFVEKEAMTFSMTVPRDVLDEFITKVFQPMFNAPQFDGEEVARLVRESETQLKGQLRYQNIEMLGLEALDNYIFDGGSYAHTVTGSVQGLSQITQDALRAFYAAFFRPENMILGVSSTDHAVLTKLSAALAGAGKSAGKGAKLQFDAPTAPSRIEGRELTIVAMPDAGATGIHLGFPIEIDRSHPDFAALYVASVYFGTHRDGHGKLYEQIRQERGYNYGDYAYVEHFAHRPFNLFPPFNTPRRHQYFSIWIRPVGDEYAHHLLKAAVYELENLIERGVSEADVIASKNKARVLYLNLGETAARLLAARVDDAYWGMNPGYLDGYLERIEDVTTAQVNAAVHKYLQADDLKIVIVTDATKAYALAEDIADERNHAGKSLADYQIASSEIDGETVIQLPEGRLATIQRDAVWNATWLGLSAEHIRVVPVEALFETGNFIAASALEADAK